MANSVHHPKHPQSDLVPLAGLPQGTSQVLPDPSVLVSLGRHLESFSEHLTSTERRALSAILNIGDPAYSTLSDEPPEAVLKPEEIEIYERLRAAPAPTGQGLRPYTLFIMKATRHCNLRCTYCFSWSDEPNQTMGFEVLASTIHGALQAPGVRSVEFLWHGGEPTLLRTDTFYRKALWLQERFRKPGQKVTNNLQTNATNLTSEWLDFITRYRFKVGVSLDGPPEVHDLRRFDVAGRPTSERVREGLANLQKRGVNHGVVMVLDDDVIALGADRILSYLLELGVAYVGLLNVVPEGDPKYMSPEDPYLSFSRFVDFLRDLFRLWWPDHTEKIIFREISELLSIVQGGAAKDCVFDGNCMGGFLTIDPNGDISACDKYVGNNDYRFGNVLEMDLADLPASPDLIRVHAETDSEIEGASQCPWFEMCQSGCPYDRYVRTVHRRGTHDERCCGWAPLLSEMAEAVGRKPNAGPEPITQTSSK